MQIRYTACERETYERLCALHDTDGLPENAKQQIEWLKNHVSNNARHNAASPAQ